MEVPFVVAIDGVGGAGKSTTAGEVAKRMGLLHLDTGAMYRSVTLAALEAGIPFSEVARVEAVAAGLQMTFDEAGILMVNGRRVGDEIRTPKVSISVSDYCQVPGVRRILVEHQRKIAAVHSCVAEGRDMGTVVFPDADFKFFLTASPRVRAERRALELRAKGIHAEVENVLRELEERDAKDSGRELSPLRKAKDAEEIDTSYLSIDQQVLKILEFIRIRRKQAPTL